RACSGSHSASFHAAALPSPVTSKSSVGRTFSSFAAGRSGPSPSVLPRPAATASRAEVASSMRAFIGSHSTAFVLRRPPDSTTYPRPPGNAPVGERREGAGRGDLGPTLPPVRRAGAHAGGAHGPAGR